MLVVNPSASPVPVTGHVTFAGQHGHPLPVSISNTPVLVNINNGPLQMRDVDDPARHIFQKHILSAIPSSSADRIFSSFVAPANNRLVIEYVSADVAVPARQKVIFTIVLSSFSAAVPSISQGAFLGGDEFIAGQQVRIYVEPGETVTMFIRRNASTGTWTPTDWSVVGYLVDCTVDAPCPPSP